MHKPQPRIKGADDRIMAAALRAEHCQKDLTPDHRKHLRQLLKVPYPDVGSIRQLGWAARNSAWFAPLEDGNREITGAILIAKDGKESSQHPRPKGLILLQDWGNRQAPVAITAGVANTLAARSLGFVAVGFPPDGDVVDLLAEVLSHRPPEEPILVFSDEQAGFGLPKAKTLGRELSTRLGKAVSAVTLPSGPQSLHAWGVTNVTEPTEAESWSMAGDRLRPLLQHHATAPDGIKWEEPVPLDKDRVGPPFPTHLLPGWLCRWAEAEAEATQTPPDLAAMLALALCGAGIAGKFRVTIRTRWGEPLNLFTVVALPPGDRKSAVFSHATAPVFEVEREDARRLAPDIAAAATRKRILEARLKDAERRAAKEKDRVKRGQFEHEAISVAEELSSHHVPPTPKYVCDDATPEILAEMLAQHGGRMLQAAAEGTALEIAKGRYSETANFDVYLKGWGGDPLRTDRVGREGGAVDQPALSVALAVQPDVIGGLADQASMKGRGFLARFLYAIPPSKVGRRTISAPPVPDSVAAEYGAKLSWLWKTQHRQDATGKCVAADLTFTDAADAALAEFEGWLEPRLREDSDLHLLAGWANKLAGAIARISAIMHVAEQAGRNGGIDPAVSRPVVERAIALGRDYLLPHALAAFGMMGADPKVGGARAVLRSLPELVAEDGSVSCVSSVVGGPTVSRRKLHNRHQKRFPKVEELDPVLDLLVRHGYLKPTGEGKPGRGGNPSPSFFVHPDVLAAPPQGRTPDYTGYTGYTGAAAPPMTEGEI